MLKLIMINKKHQYKLYTQHRSLLYHLMFVSIIGYLFFSILCFGQTTGSNLESQVKAAYIYNFTKFIYWNTQKNNLKNKPITIFILGIDPVGDVLEDFSKKQTEGRPIIVKKIKNGKTDISDCHLLFIGQSEQQQLPVIFKQLKGTNVLTVSDISEFAHQGGMIGFIVEDGKVKVEINMNAVNNAGLKISAKLLEIARIISDEG